MNDASLLKKENRTCFASESLITVKQYSSQRTDNAVLAKLRGDETAEGLKKTAADLVFAPTPAACEVCS